MKKRKLVCLLLALCCFVTAFAGCGKEEKTSTSSIEVSGVNEFPIVKEKVELDVFAVKSSFIKDFETNEFTQWYEEKTGVHINWIVPSGDAQQAFNLMIASGEYPDVILGMGLWPEPLENLVDQGIIADITDVVDEHGYYIKKMYESEPALRDFGTVDGRLYGVANATSSFDGQYQYCMWLYEPWLKKLGLEKPETLDELYEILKAFKENDLNGNGKADEIPLAARGVDNYGSGIEAYLMSSFLPDDGMERLFFDENGKIAYTAVQPEFREGLRYMKKLYDEGLIYEDTFILDRTQITAIGENETPILGASTGSYQGFFCNPSGTTERYHEFVAIPPVEGPDGFRGTVRRVNTSNGNSFIVMKNCKYPEVAVKWVDWLYSFEGVQQSQASALSYYRPAEEGELGLDGEQAKWTLVERPLEEQEKFSGTSQNVSWLNAGVWYKSLEDSIKVHDTVGDLTKKYEVYEMYSKYSYDVPIVRIAKEYVEEYADYVMINEEVDSYVARFVTGELDLDKDWDSYIKALKGLGLDRYLEIIQKSYDKK